MLTPEDVKKAAKAVYKSEWDRQHREERREANRQWKKDNREIVRASKRRWRQRNKGEKRRDSNLSKYGVDTAWFNEKVQEQGGGCGMCGAPDTGKHHLHVDHCHTTGKVRGVLCYRCNIFLAHFEHNPNRVELAKAYLERYAKV